MVEQNVLALAPSGLTRNRFQGAEDNIGPFQTDLQAGHSEKTGHLSAYLFAPVVAGLRLNVGVDSLSTD